MQIGAMQALISLRICAGNAQADQGLHCPLTKSMDIVVYVHEQKLSSSFCMDVHAHLDLCCWYMVCGPFSYVAHQIINLICFTSEK